VLQSTWNNLLIIIKEEAGSRIVETWLKAVVLEQWDPVEKKAFLRAPNIFVRDWIQKNCIDLLQTHLGRLLNVEKPKIIIVDGPQRERHVSPSDVASYESDQDNTIFDKPTKQTLSGQTLSGQTNSGSYSRSYSSGAKRPYTTGVKSQSYGPSVQPLPLYSATSNNNKDDEHEKNQTLNRSSGPTGSFMPATVQHGHRSVMRPIKNNNYEAATKYTAFLNKNHTFESFVVGPSNSLAYAAVKAVAEKPGKLYNPLFIYGDSGLGKTHLLHAVGNEIKLRNPEAAILYQTADRFVNEFINAIRFDKIHAFQAKYREIDVLLIDDIQFISNKGQTQEAFFHIFNALYEAHKQIVFTSDVFPQDIKGLEQRLRSRLSSGLVTDVHKPSVETKIAILRKKASLTCDQTIDDEVINFIASRVISNIRSLEGALIRVIAFASLTQQKITLELAKKVLVREQEQTVAPIDEDKIVTCLRKYYPYTFEDLCSKSRNKDIVVARQVCMYLFKKKTNKSLRDIGVLMGNRDHSTVMHAIEKIEDYAQKNADFNARLRHMEQEL